ncbi:unnamed protein product, partial [Prorocentrum cordatum]
QDGDSIQSKFYSIVRRARAAVPQAVPQSDGLTVPLATSASPPAGSSDLERGDGEPQWASWARGALDRARRQAEEAAEQARQNLSEGLEKAKSTDWSEQMRVMQDRVSTSTSSASSSFSEGTRSFHESTARIIDRAKTLEMSEQADNLRRGVSRGLEQVSQGAASVGSALSESSGQAAQKAREGASAAAQGARGALSVVGERAHGAASLAMDPRKLLRFGAVFGVGLLLILISLNFLPMLLLKPQMFASFFTMGSMTTMSAFALLAGPAAFAAAMAQPKKLPFAAAYIVGLIGTLWATLIKHSYMRGAISSGHRAALLRLLLPARGHRDAQHAGPIWRPQRQVTGDGIAAGRTLMRGRP